MPRRRKLLILAGAFVVVVVTLALWLRPKGYVYQGKTVKQWFEDYNSEKHNENRDDYDPFALGREKRRIKNAFVEMGTNAVPFLVGRINQDFNPTLFERAVGKLPRGWQPRSPDRRFSEATTAAHLLHDCVKLTESELREMLKPALLSNNPIQKQTAERALPRTPSGHPRIPRQKSPLPSPPSR
jgi:hypothetical protein